MGRLPTPHRDASAPRDLRKRRTFCLNPRVVEKSRGLPLTQFWVADALRNPCRLHASWRKAGFWPLVSTSILLLAVLPPNLEHTGVAANNSAGANQLVREVIQNEIQAEPSNNNMWSYRELTNRKGKELLLEYCQTKYGTIHRLLAVNGHPLNPSQRQAEDIRIQKLLRSPDAVRAAQKKERADAQEERKFLRLFLDAFRYQEEGQQGDLMKLGFRPNSDFHPSTDEERVLHSLKGTMVVDVQQKRLVSVNGRLTTEVKFWGGLAGHLNAGGTFSVLSENVAPGDWELKSLDVEMNGKALLFKTITVREQDTYSSYTLVPPSTSLAQAAERLQKDSSG